MFPDLKKFTESDKLRKLMANARRLGHDDYAFLCQLRIAELAGSGFKDELEREFWTAVAAAEEFKTFENGKATKLAKIRLKHKKVGTKQVLNDLALDPAVSEGFAMLAGNGRPDLAVEAIVVRHRDEFSPEAVASAEAKLEANGVSPDQLVVHEAA